MDETVENAGKLVVAMAEVGLGWVMSPELC